MPVLPSRKSPPAPPSIVSLPPLHEFVEAAVSAGLIEARAPDIFDGCVGIASGSAAADAGLKIDDDPRGDRRTAVVCLVLTRSAIHPVIAETCGYDIVAGSTVGVLEIACKTAGKVQRVIAGVARKVVVAASGLQGIVAGASEKVVIAIAALEQIRAIEASEYVAAAIASQDVCQAGAGEDVVTGVPGNVVCFVFSARQNIGADGAYKNCHVISPD